MSDVSFSIKVSVDGINSDVAERVVAHFQDETYYFEDTDLDSIHSDVQEYIDEQEDLTDDEKTGAEVLVELSEVYSEGSSSHFTNADFAGKDFDDVEEMLRLEEEHGKAYVVYVQTMDDISESGFREAYFGEFDSGTALAQQFCENCYDMQEIPDWIKGNIDWDGVWNDMKYDYWEEDGFYFLNI